MPESIQLAFIALSNTKDMLLGNIDKEPSASIFEELLRIFSEEILNKDDGPAYQIRTFQPNTPELCKKIDDLIEKYKNYNKKIFQLRTYFQKLYEGEYFAFYPAEQLTSESRELITQTLISFRDDEPVEVIRQQINESFGELLKIYRIVARDESIHQSIGEPDKLKRVCRFCKRSTPDVTFKNIAHAIAESLGNKTLILNEECDSCNSDFGSAEGIETALITFLKPFTTIFGITGKKGVPKLRGENFGIEHLAPGAKRPEPVNMGETEIDELKLNLDEPKLMDFTGDFKADINFQDLYRTLVKYALSVLDTSEMSNFDGTIDWINRKVSGNELPKLAILKSFRFFKKQPGMMVYLQTGNDKKLPYAVGQFQHTFFTFVFIIPFTKVDEINFSTDAGYENFWKTFKHFSQIRDWHFYHVNKDFPVPFHAKLEFKSKDSSEDVSDTDQ